MPITNYRDKTFIVGIEDPPALTAGSAFIHAMTDSEMNTLEDCDDHGGKVRIPKSMAEFRAKFRFDYVICYDCFSKAVAAGKIDNAARAGADRLLTMPGFLRAGEWCVHTSGQGRYTINKEGNIISSDADTGVSGNSSSVSSSALRDPRDVKSTSAPR